MHRHEHFGDAEAACKIGGVQRPCSTKGQKSKPTWVLSTALEREPKIDRHIGVDDLENTGGGRHEIQAERPSDNVYDRLRRARAVERHAAAKHALCSERAKDEVRIGNGRHRAAAAVAGRTRDRKS